MQWRNGREQHNHQPRLQIWFSIASESERSPFTASRSCFGDMGCMFAKRRQRAARAFPEDVSRRPVHRQGNRAVYLAEGSAHSVAWSITSALFALALAFNYLSVSQDRLVLNDTASVWYRERKSVDTAISEVINWRFELIMAWKWVQIKYGTVSIVITAISDVTDFQHISSWVLDR